MPEKKTVARAKKARKVGKAPGTHAGEFVHAEGRPEPSEKVAAIRSRSS